ncbi:enolase C-terminal domain-like protein [Luedemannella helvata]|uniref:Mandelate racemase/muconate lactonizing enzyme C-terminal domain-containing protein n=1 Tax=Luedemannella helvata TaxID=349315 RepID=A0ABP4VTW3_9ACTN
MLGIPVHTLLGGARRARVRVYASGFLYQEGRHPAEVWPAEAVDLVERGFRSLKLRIGGYPAEEELPLLARLREDLPADVTLMVDAWGSYDAVTAERVGRRLGELGVAWFEEPCPALPAGLADRLEVPIAGGEMGRTATELVDLIDSGALDVVQPDAAICGGLGAAQIVGVAAARRGVRCVPHTWNGAVMAAATLHLAAALPLAARTGDGTAGPLLEYDTSENPFMCDVVVDPPRLVDGCFTVPDSPGLGVELDERALDRFVVDRYTCP